MSDWSSRYLYTDENVDAYAPAQGGVYRLIYKKGEKYYVFYVGQSNNLNRRLHEHLGAGEKDACIKRHLKNYECYFRFIQIDSEEERDRVEQSQIRKYDPPCNK